MKVKLQVIEPGLEGTIIGKVRLVMRDLGLGDKSPARFFDALERAGLQIDHLDEKPTK